MCHTEEGVIHEGLTYIIAPKGGVYFLSDPKQESHVRWVTKPPMMAYATNSRASCSVVSFVSQTLKLWSGVSLFDLVSKILRKSGVSSSFS
jgi:hypothetical protein